MADDDFDIDIYGDTEVENESSVRKEDTSDEVMKGVDATNGVTAPAIDHDQVAGNEEHDDYIADQPETSTNSDHNMRDEENSEQPVTGLDKSGQDTISIPKQAPQQQGVKRKEGSDDRPVDPGATTAILISDLHWWNTDDDVRGWINQAQCEDELRDITFGEHKANGKSKGQAYVEFTSQQAATAAKQKILSFGDGQQYVKKHTVTYSNPNINPFKTLPKDAPARNGKDTQSTRGGGGSNYNDRNSQNTVNNYNNFRGGRMSGYNSGRGNMNNVGGGFNRNFSGGNQMGGMGGGGFQPMGFQSNAMGGNFGNFNRGGMMNNIRGSGNMRGGRGNMGGGMMGGMGPMGNMGIGGMPSMPMGGLPNMAMGPNMPGNGFSMQPHFNPAFFPQNQAAGGDWQNPHGVKRPRPE